jgi:hypothetical protein
MTLYRVVDASDAITTWESVGEEIRRLHRTADGAHDAIAGMDWDADWGKEPELEVVEITGYETIAEARADGWQVVK